MDDAHKELAKRLLETYWAGAPYMRELLDKSADALEEMAAERDRLKAALEPFAKLSTDRERQDPPEGTMRVRVVTAPEIEAARKALGGDAS